MSLKPHTVLDLHIRFRRIEETKNMAVIVRKRYRPRSKKHSKDERYTEEILDILENKKMEQYREIQNH